jgi:outer membrane biosynthesis protein TonB
MKTVYFAATAFLSGCMTGTTVKPPPEPMLRIGEQASNECRALGMLTRPAPHPDYPVTALKMGQEGWVRAKVDVYRGQITKSEIVASSPKGLFDNSIREWLSKSQYPTNNSAQGCHVEYIFKIHIVR